MLNIQSLRDDTPGTQTLTHFNNAGAALPTNQTLKAITDYISDEAVVGGYAMHMRHSDKINAFYTNAARLINASADEIAVTENATAAFTRILYAIDFQEGDVILTSEIEYGNNFINFIHLKNKVGVVLKIIPNLPNGDFDLHALEDVISDKVKLIAITHVPTSSGVVAPVEAIGRIARAHNILYLVDACQSIGQLPFDVEKIGCDFASTTARKYLRGPRGLGFLYVRRSALDQLEPAVLDLEASTWNPDETVSLQKSAKMFESFEKSYALVCGFSEAIRYLLDLGVENTWQRIREMAAYTREQIGLIPGARVHDPGSLKCGIVTFTMEGVGPAQIKQVLSANQINTSVSLPFSSLTDMQGRGLSAAVRASVHYYNTKEEVDRLVIVLAKIHAEEPINEELKIKNLE